MSEPYWWAARGIPPAPLFEDMITTLLVAGVPSATFDSGVVPGAVGILCVATVNGNGLFLADNVTPVAGDVGANGFLLPRTTNDGNFIKFLLTPATRYYVFENPSGVNVWHYVTLIQGG